MHRAAKAAFVYEKAKRHLDLQSLSAHDIFVGLLTSAYKPRVATDEFWSEVVRYEVKGVGYTTGGQRLTDKVVTSVGAMDLVTLRAADMVWSDSTITARFAVIFDATPPSDATRPLLAYVDFGVDIHSDDGAFRVNWDPMNGIIEARRS